MAQVKGKNLGKNLISLDVAVLIDDVLSARDALGCRPLTFSIQVRTVQVTARIHSIVSYQRLFAIV
jgi:hypothetical protein